MSALAEITTLRLDLADLHQQLRDWKREMDAAEARLTLTTEGRNADERKARLTLALESDPPYRTAQRHHDRLTLLIEQREAALEEYRDARREFEWSVRLRLAEALERQAIASERPGDDSSINDAADHRGDVAVNTALRRPGRAA